MEVEIIFATASGGYAAHCGGSPTEFIGIRKCFSKSSYGYEIHFREIMTGVILTIESHG
jgi:hypothetical protein